MYFGKLYIYANINCFRGLLEHFKISLFSPWFGKKKTLMQKVHKYQEPGVPGAHKSQEK